MRRLSLRGRVAVLALGALACALAAVGAFVYASLDHRLNDDLHRRVAFRAQLAAGLAGEVSDQTLADRLAGDGVEAILTRDGAVVASARPAPDPTLPKPPKPKAKAKGKGAAAVPPPTPPAPKLTAPADGRVRVEGHTVTLDQSLPGGAVLTLRAGDAEVRQTLGRVLALELLGSLVALLLAALAIWRLVGVALRPLDTMTAVALRTARGRGGERLAPERTDTELGRAAAAFDEMLDAQDDALAQSRASEARIRTFVADAGHELRTPLTGLQLSAETLLRGVEDPQERERLALRVVRETRRTNRLVSDLLDAARLGDGVELRRERTDVAAIAAEEVERVRAAHPGLRVVLHAADEVPADADAARIGQVIANLIDNARHAGSEIAVEVAHDGPDVRVTVDDDGPGVAPGDRERIFERLVRLDAGRGRDRFGAGLGLTIARAIAEAHGGTLTCGDGELGGARFSLAMPAALPQSSLGLRAAIM